MLFPHSCFAARMLKHVETLVARFPTLFCMVFFSRISTTCGISCHHCVNHPLLVVTNRHLSVSVCHISCTHSGCERIEGKRRWQEDWRWPAGSVPLNVLPKCWEIREKHTQEVVGRHIVWSSVGHNCHFLRNDKLTEVSGSRNMHRWSHYKENLIP